MQSLPRPIEKSRYRLLPPYFSQITPALTLLIASVVFIALWWDGAYIGHMTDSVVYLLMAEGINPSTPRMQAITSAYWSLYPFPPLYPLTLALIGPSTANLHAAHSFSLVCSLVAGWLIYRYYRQNLSVGRLASSALLLGQALCLENLLSVGQIASEPLYLVLTLSAILTFRKHANWPRSVVFALLVGLAIQTRSIGLALAVAAGIAWWASNRFTRSQGFSAVVFWLLPMLVGKLLRPIDTVTGYDYGSALLQAFSGLWTTLSTNAEGLLVGFSSYLFTFEQPIVAHFSAGTIAALALIGLIKRRRSIDAIYAFAYVGILLIWPYPDHATRLLWPVVPLMLGHALIGAQITAGLIGIGPSPAAVLYTTVAVIGLSLTTLPHMDKLRMPLAAELRPFRMARQVMMAPDRDKAQLAARQLFAAVDIAQRAAEIVHPEQCIYSLQAEFVTLYSGRAGKKLPFLQSATPTNMDACPYLFASSLLAHNFEIYPLFPLREIGLYFTPRLIANDWINPDVGTLAIFGTLELPGPIHGLPQKPML